MGLTWDKDPAEWFEGIKKDLGEKASAAAEESFAQQLAEKARENKLATVDSIKLTTEITGDDEGMVSVDEDNIRQRANEILAAEQ